MLFASLSMISNKSGVAEVSDEVFEYNPYTIFFLGLITGVISGFVGAGGGFLNIPVLVLFVRLPMKKAIGTSLFIISIKYSRL